MFLCKLCGCKGEHPSMYCRIGPCFFRVLCTVSSARSQRKRLQTTSCMYATFGFYELQMIVMSYKGMVTQNESAQINLAVGIAKQ